MNILFSFIFITLFFLAGMGLILGTKRRCPWLVDPPVDKWWIWIFYSHSFGKKIFGKKFLIIFNYFLGTLFIFASLLGLWNCIFGQ